MGNLPVQSDSPSDPEQLLTKATSTSGSAEDTEETSTEQAKRLLSFDFLRELGWRAGTTGHRDCRVYLQIRAVLPQLGLRATGPLAAAALLDATTL
jgi:hypothetical protein